MPNLGGLLEAGKWTDVVSSELGSGSVWLDFLGGEDVFHHGVVSEWHWDPKEMALRRYDPSPVTPFYKSLQEKNVVLGTLDVPFDPGDDHGFAVREWGVHYVIEGKVSATPGVARAAIDSMDPHPYSLKLLHHYGFHEVEAMQENVEGSLRGIALRGDLADRLLREVRPEFALITFQELHHAGHFLWHTSDPGHVLYSDLPQQAKYLPSGVKEIYQAADREVGRLIDKTRPQSIMVFSLNGMEPYRGTPDLLSRLLHRDGYAHVRTHGSKNLRDRASALMGYAKRKSPSWAKDLYHRTTSREFQRNVARATLMEQLEWSTTRAFELAPEEVSLLRLNLIDREAAGILDESEYTTLLREIAEKIGGLQTEDGRSAALRVLTTDQGSPTSPLPDLIVRWNHEVTYPPGKIVGFPTHDMHSSNHTGHHHPLGYCVSWGPISDELPERILTEDLHRPILRMFAPD